MPTYEKKLPFDSSLMVYFRKRFTPEILGDINEMIISKTKIEASKSSENLREDDALPPGEGSGKQGTVEEENVEVSNAGELIVDATCVPQNIRYPQDLSLLNEGRENLEKIVDLLHDLKDGVKPRTYRRRAHKDY
jgi:hypothetical protein